MKKLIEELLTSLGEDPSRQGLARTPERVDRSLRFLTSGYDMKLNELINGALLDRKSVV